MYKKCRVVVLLIKPIVFLTFSLSSQFRKVPSIPGITTPQATKVKVLLRTGACKFSLPNLGHESHPRRFLCETRAQQISCGCQFGLLCQQQLTFGL